MRITKYTETVFRDRVYIDIEGIAEPCMRPAKPLKGDPHGKPAERVPKNPKPRHHKRADPK